MPHKCVIGSKPQSEFRAIAGCSSSSNCLMPVSSGSADDDDKQFESSYNDSSMGMTLKQAVVMKLMTYQLCQWCPVDVFYPYR